MHALRRSAVQGVRPSRYSGGRHLSHGGVGASGRSLSRGGGQKDPSSLWRSQPAKSIRRPGAKGNCDDGVRGIANTGCVAYNLSSPAYYVRGCSWNMRSAQKRERSLPVGGWRYIAFSEESLMCYRTPRRMKITLATKTPRRQGPPKYSLMWLLCGCMS
jgi:hypothetical protein